MAHNTTPRRFYIDHAENHAVVRAVQVQHRVAAPAETPETIATHQVAPVEADTVETTRLIAMRARIAPRAVTGLVRSARKHAHRI